MGEEWGSHFSQTFSSKHHGPVNDEGRLESLPVRSFR